MEMPNTDTSGKTPLFVANLIVTIISVCFMWLVIPIISFVASLLGVIFSSRMSNWNSAKKNRSLIISASICLGVAILTLVGTPFLLILVNGIGQVNSYHHYLEEESMRATTAIESTIEATIEATKHTISSLRFH